MSDRISILRALMLMHSFIYNPRRTEDLTHPLWDRLVGQLCDRISEYVLPTPQFKLYTSPRDKVVKLPTWESDLMLRTSTGTVPDSQARGVVTDFCALMPLLSLRSSPGENLDMKKLQYFIESGGIRQNLWLLRMFVLALIELKRPVSRSIVDMAKFVHALVRSMGFAQEQVENQATCLFGSPKYADQQSVILVAAVGEWWTARIFAREDVEETFNLGKYEVMMDNNERKEREDMEDQEILRNAEGDMQLEESGQDDVIVGLNEMNSEMDSMLARGNAFEEQRTAIISKRQERANERSRKREAADIERKLEIFLYETDPQLATEDTLSRFSLLWDKSKSPIKEKIDLSEFEVGSISKDGPITRESLTSWTGLMKVGSDISDAYMEFIKGEFATAVNNHMC